MPFDPGGFFDFLIRLLAEVGESLSLNPRAAEDAPTIIGTRMAISVIFLAGISEGFGTQAAVLFVNQLSRRNFYLNLLVSGVLFLVGAVGWIVSIMLIAALVYDVVSRPNQVLRVVSIGYFPLLFGFVGLAPYIGPGLVVLLHAWSFLIVLIATASVLKLTLLQAFVCTIAGWLVVQLLRRLMNRPRAIVNRWLWKMTTGQAQPRGFDDVPIVLPVRQDGSVQPTESRA